MIGGVLGPSVRPQSSFAGNETGQVVQRAAPLEFAKPQMRMFPVHTVRPQWRIGLDGHLERSMGADQWTRVLGDQPITFRAVAVAGE